MSDAPKLIKTVRAMSERWEPKLAKATLPLDLWTSLLIGRYSTSSASTGLGPTASKTSRLAKSSAEKDRLNL